MILACANAYYKYGAGEPRQAPKFAKGFVLG